MPADSAPSGGFFVAVVLAAGRATVGDAGAFVMWGVGDAGESPLSDRQILTAIGDAGALSVKVLTPVAKKQHV